MKVGIVGLGFRLGYLGYVFRTIDSSFDIVGYVDPEPAGLRDLSEKGISAGKSYDTLANLLASETLDLLMIGSPNHMHLDHIREGLEAGLKVFCEKPIVTTIAESLELARLMTKFGHERLMVGLVLRYSPLYKDLRDIQAAGTLGNIVSIEAAEHIEPYHGGFFMRDWRRCWRNAATTWTSTMAWSGRDPSGLQASAGARASFPPTIQRGKGSTI